MSSNRPRLQRALYRIFVVSGALATILGLLFVWGLEPRASVTIFLARVLATCLILAVASAFALSANRLVQGRPPEDDAG